VTIFVPDIAEEKLNEKIKRIKNLISSSNGEVIKEENWGNKKLAYEIKKFSNGIYYFIFCSVEKTTFVNDIKNLFSKDENILRYGVKKIDSKKIKIEQNVSQEQGSKSKEELNDSTKL
jgi:small subunit ribosomal protein S6